jgi:hypothetical protein
MARVSTEVTFWHSAEYGSDFRLNSGEIPRNSAGIEQKSLQKSKTSAEFRVGGIPWTPYSWPKSCFSSSNMKFYFMCEKCAYFFPGRDLHIILLQIQRQKF